MGMTLPNARGRRGKPLETLVLRSAELQPHLLVIDKTEPGARRVGEGRTVAVAGPCDFRGELRPSGRAIVFDAKETAKPQGFYLCDLPDHQRAFLVRHGGAGAVAGLLVWAKAADRLYWCGWRVLAEYAVNREPCVPFGEMTDLGRGSAGMVDFGKVPGVRV